MTPDRWTRVKDLVTRAIPLDPAARHAFLRQECGTDEELCRQVLVLLDTDEHDETLARGGGLAPADMRTLGPGDHVGPYIIAFLKGAGGMGQVYKAEDPRLGRDIALKVLPEEFAEDAARLKRFEREARAASSLNHPNIVTIYDVGAHGAQPYIAMEFVTGQTLRERLEAAASFDEDKLLDLTIPIAEGLAQAHAAGIVHRDLKPENIMITPEGRVKVLDFGIAKLGGVQADRTLDSLPDTRRGGTKGVLGTVGYMSPEQAEGKPVDFRSDQFSLGAILYEMAAGRRAFIGRSAFETLMAIHTTDPPPLPGTLVPGSLGSIVTRCLRKNPAARFARTAELVDALKGLRRRGGWKRTPARFARLGFVAVALTALSIAGLRMQKDRAVPAVEPITSLAVMPFTNDTGDAESEYLSDGITDNVIAHLSEIPSLRVMARNTVFRFKGHANDPREIGRTLGVRAVVLGRIRRRAQAFAADAELVDTQTGARLWGAQLEREARDVARLQADISREISKNLRLALTERAQHPSDRGEAGDPEAYRLCLQGRYYWNKRTFEDLSKGLQLFEEAALKHPDSAPAHAGVADSQVLLAWYGFVPTREALPKAREAAERAIALDPNLMEPRCALAYVRLYHDWNGTEAGREFARALQLNPRHPRPHHWYAYYLGVLGKLDEAIKELGIALDLDPLNLAVHSSLATFYNQAGQHERALSQARRTLDIEPKYFGAYLVLAWTYDDMGRPTDALAALDDARRFGANKTTIDTERVRLLAALGRRDEARALLSSLEGPGSPYAPPLDLAAAHLAVGDKDGSIALLHKAVEERGMEVMTLRRSTLFRGLADDPRFQALLDTIGKPS